MQKIKTMFSNLKTTIYSKVIRLQNPEIFNSESNDDGKTIEVVLENPIVEAIENKVGDQVPVEQDVNVDELKKDIPILEKKSSKPAAKKPVAKKKI